MLLRWIAIILFFSAMVARAQTLPATTQSLDQSSPKALLRSFYLSHGDVDEATIRSVLHATNPLEMHILDSVVKIELANARLRAAEKQKFGHATTRPAITPPPIKPDTAADLDALTETIEGDRATVAIPADPASSLEFVKIDGKWKLPIASLVGPIDPAMAETLASTTRAQIQIIEALTAEVLSGKLTSEEQVRTELTRRFTDRLAAATRSTTQQAPSAGSAPGT